MLDQNSIVNLENRNGPAETSSFRESGHKKNHPRVSMYSSKTPPGPVEEHFWYTYTNSARVDIFGGTEYFWGKDQFNPSCLPLIKSKFSRFWMVYNSFFLKKLLYRLNRCASKVICICCCGWQKTGRAAPSPSGSQHEPGPFFATVVFIYRLFMKLDQSDWKDKNQKWGGKNQFSAKECQA